MPCWRELHFYERDFARAEHGIGGCSQKPRWHPPWQYLDLLAGSIAQGREMRTEHLRLSIRLAAALEVGAGEHANEPALIANLGWAYAGLGRKEDALRKIQQAVQLVPSWRDATEGP